MTLNEAIEHTNEVASTCDGECAAEHRQLAAWLHELVMLRAENVALRNLAASAINKLEPSCSDCEIMDECHKRMDEAKGPWCGWTRSPCLFVERYEEQAEALGIF